MSDEIKTFKEWSIRPSYHGSYGDYVSHMKGMIAYLEREKEDRLVKRIAEELRKNP